MPSNQIWISTENAPFIHQRSVKGHKQGYGRKDSWKSVEYWITKNIVSWFCKKIKHRLQI